jgi:hypothetical protein
MCQKRFNVDRAVGNAFPKFLPVFPFAHRRTTFNMRVPITDILGGECQ